MVVDESFNDRSRPELVLSSVIDEERTIAPAEIYISASL